MHCYIVIIFGCSVDDGWLSPVLRERHIGIDQGIRNWAMVAIDVDMSLDGVQKTKLVAADLCDLQARRLNTLRLDPTELLLCLQRHTPLMSWLQHESYVAVLEPVDRVVVHIEQVSKKNRYNKQFTVEFGSMVQRLMDVTKCVVKLSQPFQHGARGPLFKLGKDIVAACNLKPVSMSMTSTSRVRRPARQVLSDVEPSSSDENVPPQVVVESKCFTLLYWNFKLNHSFFYSISSNT